MWDNLDIDKPYSLLKKQKEISVTFSFPTLIYKGMLETKMEQTGSSPVARICGGVGVPGSSWGATSGEGAHYAWR